MESSNRIPISSHTLDELQDYVALQEHLEYCNKCHIEYLYYESIIISLRSRSIVTPLSKDTIERIYLSTRKQSKISSKITSLPQLLTRLGSIFALSRFINFMFWRNPLKTDLSNTMNHPNTSLQAQALLERKKIRASRAKLFSHVIYAMIILILVTCFLLIPQLNMQKHPTRPSSSQIGASIPTTLPRNTPDPMPASSTPKAFTTPTTTPTLTPTPISTHIPVLPPAANGNVLVGYQWTYDQSQHVVYIDANGHIQNLSDIAGEWKRDDLTQELHLPATNGRTLAGYQFSGDGAQHIVYITSSGDIEEISQQEGSSWVAVDLTQILNLPSANGKTLAGCEYSVYPSQNIYYITTFGDIEELYQIQGNSWVADNFTQTLQSQGISLPPANGNTLTSYEDSAYPSHNIDYITTSGDIEEIFQIGRGAWVADNFTQALQSQGVSLPPTNGKVLMGYQYSLDQSQHLDYITTSGDIEEVVQIQHSNWNADDLTQAHGGRFAANGFALAGYEWAYDQSQHIVYIDANGHIHEIFDRSGNWENTDLLIPT